MNALTFGLLITALGGFAQGQSGALVAAEVMAMLVVGFFFLSAASSSRRSPLLPVDLLRIPLFSLSICTSICSFLRPDAGDGFAAVLPAVNDGA